MTRLELRRLRLEVGGRLLLDGVELEAAGGNAVAVLGPSGSGKTSLLSVLAGDVAPAGGEVLVDGQRLRPGDARHVARIGRVADRPVGRLSGGQRQRVGVARALAPAPDLLLLDEPTSELDEATRDAVVDVLREEVDRGALLVVATHDQSVAAGADQRLVLHPVGTLRAG